MTAPLQLKLFGSPQIHFQGQPLTGFVSAKVRALLIYLAVTARPHSRDHLAHLLWEDTPASMKPNLRKALSNLRQLLGELLVEEGKELIALDAQRCWVDVVAFEHSLNSEALTEAAQLYTADFLAGFNPSLSYEFETWALGEQSRLKSGMVDLLRKLATQLETPNTLPEAIQTVRRLLALEPWQEESHRWLMALLAKNGQRSAALAHFEVCKRVLQDELAVEPSAETMQVVAQIQQTTLPIHKPAAKVPPIAQPEFPLVGREREWQTIQAAWQHCLHHGPHFVSIAGEAGIGKTRLTEEARRWLAQQGYASAYARSYAAEGALSYSPVVDWLRSEAIKPLLSQLDVIWLGEVARLLPELLVAHPHLASPKPISDGAQRRVFFEALVRALTVSARPLLLVIDDLQWCDRETLEWLRFLLRFDANQPCLVLGAFRVEEVTADHFLHELLRSLRQTNQVVEFELGTLNPEETGRLVSLVSKETVAEKQLSSLYQETSGHPLFVIECVRSGIGKVNDQGSISRQTPIISSSSKVQNVIQSRLALLSAEALALVEIAAVIGRAFSLPLLLVVSKQPEDHLHCQLAELWQRRLIAEREADLLDLTHDRVREAIYAQINPVRRKIYHRSIVTGLTTIHAANLAPASGQIASHCEQAGLIEQAITYYQQAAEHAKELSAHSEVAHYYQKALQQLLLQPAERGNTQLQIELLLELGRTRMFTHDRGSSPIKQAWQQAYELAKENGKPTQLCEAQIDMARHYRNQGDWSISQQFAQDALALAKTIDEPRLMAHAGFALAVALLHQGKLTESFASFKQVHAQTLMPMALPPPMQTVTQISSSPPDQKKQQQTTEYLSLHAGSHLRFAQCLWLLGFPDQARLRTVETLNFIRQLLPTDECMVLHHYSMILYFCQDIAMVKQIGQELIALAPKLGEIIRLNLGKMALGWSLAKAGDATTGLNLVQTSIASIDKSAGTIFRPIWLSMLIEAKILAGEAADALQDVTLAIDHVNETTNRYWLAHLLKLQGDLYHIQSATLDKIEQSYQKALTVARSQNARTLELRVTTSLSRLWQSQGKTAAAYQLLAPIYAWFTEGFDTPDLIEARQLLDELATTVH